MIMSGFPPEFIPHLMRDQNDLIGYLIVIPAKAGIQNVRWESEGLFGDFNPMLFAYWILTPDF